MAVTYGDGLPERDPFGELFESTGWNEKFRRDEEQLHETARHSWYAVSAYVDGLLAGFGRVLSDGILQALMVDLMVLPKYRGHGIGGSTMKQLVDRGKSSEIRSVQLFCAEGTAGFYEKRGFVRRPLEAAGMELELKHIASKPDTLEVAFIESDGEES